jgi:putative transcriptional regulator
VTPRRHPSEDRIAACATGALRPGADLVVRAHLAVCAECRREAQFFESLGGALLEAEPAADLQPDALARALAAIERPVPDAASFAPPEGSADVLALPPDLHGYVAGKPRRLRKGASLTPLKPNRASGELVYLLRAPPGTAFPRHTHVGSEFTCVLQGTFSDAGVRLEAGDFVEVDHEVDHQPIVGGDEPCICLISTDAPLVMRGLLPRLLQRLVGV